MATIQSREVRELAQNEHAYGSREVQEDEVQGEVYS
jgi:hypothetical protein